MKYRDIFESLPTGVFLFSDKFEDCNEQACHLLACGRDDILGHVLMDFSPPRQPDGRDSAEAAQQHIEAAFAGNTQTFRWQNCRKDNVLVDTEISMKANEIGGRRILLLSMSDITERKHVEAELRESEARFRSIFEFAAAGMAIVTLQGKMLQVNPAACRIFGYTEQEFLKQTSRTLTHPADLEFSDRHYQKLIAGKSKFVDFEKRYLRKDGSVIWGHTTGAVVCDSNNRPIYIVSLIQEVTERKLAEEELVKLNQELEMRVSERTRELELANREMESFTYSVSHDLRAPLRAIDGFSEALLEDYADKLDDDGKTYLRYLRDGSRDMSELIDGLLTLSCSTRGELMREQVDLSVLAKSVLAELYRAEPERQVSAQVAEDMWVDADARLLKAVLKNLLGNAWKYSSQESDSCIEVGVKEQEGRSVYFVKDNGAGFDMTFADKLFIPFHRLHRADEFSGTGIGLATVERIIHRHGGSVWAESAVGEGATFFFTLG
jgi:PAS domain S-box-containing protein